jgi:hypothetical protein
VANLPPDLFKQLAGRGLQAATAVVSSSGSRTLQLDVSASGIGPHSEWLAAPHPAQLPRSQRGPHDLHARALLPLGLCRCSKLRVSCYGAPASRHQRNHSRGVCPSPPAALCAMLVERPHGWPVSSAPRPCAGLAVAAGSAAPVLTGPARPRRAGGAAGRRPARVAAQPGWVPRADWPITPPAATASNQLLLPGSRACMGRPAAAPRPPQALQWGSRADRAARSWRCCCPARRCTSRRC